jgi:chromosome segregation ATPase
MSRFDSYIAHFYARQQKAPVLSRAHGANDPSGRKLPHGDKAMVSDTKQYRPSARRHAEIVGKLTRRIDELKAEVARANTGAEWSGAEFERVSADLVAVREDLRLCKQGCEDALEKFRVEQDAAVRHAVEVIRLGEENGALREELQHVNLKLSNRVEDIQAVQAKLKSTSEILASLTKQCDTLQAEKRHAEGRYIALSRQRSIEWGIIILAFVGGLAAFATLAIFGGGK